MRFQILTATGNLPNKSKRVAPVNNVVHSLFQKVRLYINNCEITTSADDYGYKAYISNLLTYSINPKVTHLTTQGWYGDDSSTFDDANELKNTGFKERAQLFRKENDLDKDFREEGANFFGRLFHDLIACQTGLPPGTSAKIKLDLSDPSFLLICPVSDTERYKIKILNIALYVPVAQLSLPVYQELNSLMTTKAQKSISIHYRRIEIRPISLPNGKEVYYTNALFSNPDLPCRMIVCFVQTKAKVGSYHLNPYNFQRKWEWEESSSSNIGRNFAYSDVERNYLEERLEERFNRIEKQFAEFTSQLKLSQSDTVPLASIQKIKKGKGKGKRSKPTQSTDDNNESQMSFEERVEACAQKRLRQFVENLPQNQPSTSKAFEPTSFTRTTRSQGDKNNSQCSSRDLEDDFQSFISDPPKVKKSAYIKKIECQINNIPLDQIEDDMTEDEVVQMYWRMFNANGMANTLFTNSITMDDFKNGYFFAVYDLSTSSRSGMSYVIPNIRVGHIRLR